MTQPNRKLRQAVISQKSIKPTSAHSDQTDGGITNHDETHSRCRTCSKLLFYCWYRNTEHVYLQEAKTIQIVPEQSELALDDIFFGIDDDISM
jgi:hypothetical protein